MAAASTSNDTEAKARFDKSWSFHETAVHALYKREVSYRLVTTCDEAAGSLQQALTQAEVPDNLDYTTKYSPTFDDGRWRVSYGLLKPEEGDSPRFSVYLQPMKISWLSKDPTARRTQCRLELKPYDDKKSLAVRTFTYTFPTSTFSDSGYGFHCMATLTKLREDPITRSKGQIVIICKVEEFADSETGEVAKAPLLTSHDLSKTFWTVSNTRPDVRFTFPDGQSIYAHSSLLSSRSTYMRVLLKSDYIEKHLRKVSDLWSELRRSEPRCEDSDFGDQSELDDDEDSSMSDDQVTEITAKEDWRGEEPMRTVVVSDFSVTTFRAFYVWLMTGCIDFLPIRSATVDSKTTVASEPSSGYAASPKSIYRLADKYSFDNLKTMAYDRIVASITPQNVLLELAHGFTSLFPSFIPVYKAYALKHWEEVTKSPSMPIALRKLVKREEAQAAYIEILQSTSGPKDD